MPIATPLADEMQFHFHSMTELIETRAREIPDKQVVSVPDKSFNYTSYTYKQINDGADKLAWYYSRREGLVSRNKGDTVTRLNTTLLAPSAVDYAIHELALAKMGHALLFCSINNSIPAITHLLKSTQASSIIVHPDYLSAAQTAVSDLESETGQVVRIIHQAEKAVWDNQDEVEPWPRALTPEEEGPLPVFIVHSSGSTGFPKPIILSHKASAFNVSGTGFNLSALTTLPLFHNHGHACFYRAIHSSKPLALFPSSIPLTTANILSALKAAPEVQGFYVVPYVLKLLAESEEGVRLLKGFRLVTYGGAACPDELGDRLVREGVRLVEHYGLTEAGQLGTSFRDFDTDKDWNYIRFTGPNVTSGVSRFLKFLPQGDRSFEIVVLDGWKGKVRSNTDDGSYATSDIFLPHPSREGAYKFVGRLDDTLVMVSGEKTNPVPIELTLKGESPYIAEAIIFGSGRSHIGALILPTDLGSQLSEREMWGKIQPVIEKANREAPSHSQLMPEMLIFLPPGTTIPRADKASIIRPKCYKLFEGVIEERYIKYERGEAGLPGQEIHKNKIYGEELKRYVAGLIKGITDSSGSLADDQDLFDYGVNSLQAARVRTTLQRELDLNGVILPGNVVFENPSVRQLSEFLEAIMSGKIDEQKGNSDIKQMQAMKNLVAKYSNFAEIPEATKTAPTLLTVVLTGATGSLGAHLLDQLLSRKDVTKVICLVRAKDDKDAMQRVEDSLKQRELSGVASRPDGSVEACASDLSLPDLGLGAERYDKIRSEVTTVIANAWSVNFTLNVESFEKGNIAAAFNLINLAITSGSGRPADFFFSSSVSAVAAHTGPVNTETVSDNPADAQGMGYARSKWVTENIIAAAAAKRGIRAETLRIGQMVGDTVHGVWNETEAISLQIKGAQAIGAMPELDETLSWLPVDLAAKAFVEIVQSSTHRPLWHVLNSSKETSWKTVYAALHKAGIKFDVCSKKEWVARLRKSDPDVSKNPTYKLLDFFASKYENESVSKRASYTTEETSKASPTIASAPNVDEEVVGKFIAAWRKTGFLA